ncbi:ribonuclease P/MRP protein subunit POP5 [Electrophorus electricus]|uniref:Ribonuclease P/MRP protein subunit POP5 n=1 Tax=Electrophorus electricus TaxID=8005 RepID=A0A4W4EQM1_ELEEL|nr:ribonuclease P/MRP protein subunit POP5 [Electrophorus electricus]
MVRIKYRYLLCEVCVSERSGLQMLAERPIYDALRAALGKAHGAHGAALLSVGSSVTYVNAYTGVVLLRFRKAHYRLLWSALPFVTSIWSRGQKVPCFFNCVHIGGTIRTCQKFLVRYSRQQLCRMLPHCKTEAEKQEVRRAVLSCSLNKFREEEEDNDFGEDGEETEA